MTTTTIILAAAEEAAEEAAAKAAAESAGAPNIWSALGLCFRAYLGKALRT